MNVVDFDYQNRPARRWDWLAAFGLAAGVFFLAGSLARANPLTGGNWLGGDLSQQYLSFFQYYRHVWAGATDQIGYSFANGLGGSMAGNWAYYLLSPFNLLTLLFPPERLPQVLYGIILLKIGWAAAAMSFMLRQIEPTLERAINLALALSYALMGYTVVYQMNLMWLDGVILLPLLVWAVRRLLDKGSFLPYTLLLALAVISNYYIAYMLAVFLVLYCAYMIIMSWYDWRRALRQLGRFVWGSLLGGLLSMVVVVPTLLDLLAGKGTQATPKLPLFIAGWTQTPAKLIIGSPSNGLPNVFIGTLALFAFVGYFFSTRFALREKIAGGLVAFVLGAGFVFNGINLFWHGLQLPQAYPFRFSFLVSFWLIYLAATQLTQIVYWHFESWFPPTLVAGAVLVYAFLLRHQVAGITPVRLALSGAFLLLLLLGIVLWQRRSARIWRWLVLLAVVGEVGANATLSMATLPRVSTAALARSSQTTLQWQNAVRKQADADWYRVAAVPLTPGQVNQSLEAGHASGTAAAGPSSTAVVNLYQALGLPAGNRGYAGVTGTQVSDALLGVQYTAVNDQTRTNLRTDLTAESVVYQRGAMTVRQSPNTLPVGFAVDRQAALGKLSPTDPLANQTLMMNTLTGADDEFFTSVPAARAVLTNVHREGTALVPSRKGRAATVTSNTPVTRQLPTYVIVQPAALHDSAVTINGEKVILPVESTGPIVVGLLPQNGQVNVRWTLRRKTEAQPLRIAQLRPAILHSAVTRLNAQAWRITKRSGNQLSGTITVGAGQQLMTLIPFASGWHAVVDGRAAPVRRSASAFLSVPLTAGKHRVTLRYKLPGLTWGMMLSILGLVLLLGTVIYGRHRKKSEAGTNVFEQ
ncbi:YfhO family protein [Schleiferilactobacillus shenzhenensis]|uniref:YfhO family protein n=1 Tax=Schleiferilactobacillus shenzhenensis TaxID=1231337 RepID=UPI0004051B53|nr:YfhO family protein [Schleiferilactobacillus shenzhenensis]